MRAISDGLRHELEMIAQAKGIDLTKTGLRQWKKKMMEDLITVEKISNLPGLNKRKGAKK